MKWLLVVVLGGLGLAVLVCGLMWGAKRYSLMKNGLRTQGKVVAIDESHADRDTSRGPRVSYYPVVEFQTRDGETVRFKGSTGSSSNEYETGSRVELVYNPRNPSEAQLVDFSQFWLGPVLITLAGLVILFLGYGAFFMLNDSGIGAAALRKKMLEERMQRMAARQKVEGRISDIREKGEGKYVLVCKGVGPQATLNDEFYSAVFNFNPDREFIGRPVVIFVDPQDPKKYSIEFGELLKEMMKRAK